MNSLEQQIESIVRQVIARLANENTPKTESKISNQSKSAATSAMGSNNNSALSLKVLGIKELESLGSITSTIVIKRGTIVTPAAKEWLKEKKIELRWATDLNKNTTSKQQNASKQIVIGQTIKNFNAASLIQQLSQRGNATEQLASTGLATLVKELSDHVSKNGSTAILVTDQIWAATIQANRHAGVNAVHCKDRIDAMNAMKQLKVNFLIVNPTGQSSHSIINMIHEITT